MFPKIAAVLGAHTELGKRVVNQLLLSPYVSRVHALAEVDPRDGISVYPREQRRLVLHLDPLDYIEETVSRYIPECDIAFCVLGCGKKDMAAMGAYKFHKTNLDIPRRFIHEMFTLGVERITLLSHTDASRKPRASEFFRVKGELESILRELQEEAAEHAPGVTIFKLPLILTNLRDATGVRGTSITTTDKVKQKAAVKMDLSPAHAVHVRDVAIAMVADMFQKLYMTETSSEIEPAFRRRDIRYDEIGGQKVVNIASQHRAMRREQKLRTRQRLTFDERISGYARKHTASGSVDQSSVRYAQTQSQVSTEPSERPAPQREENEDDSKESYMYGSPPDEDTVYDDETFYSEEFAIYRDGSSNLSHDENQGLQSPLPSPEPRHFEEDIRASGTGSFHSPEKRKRSTVPVTSVEALGDQLSRRLTFIRDNQYLPDVDSRPTQSSQRHHPDHDSNQEFLRQTGTSLPHALEHRNDREEEVAENDFRGERRDSNQSFDSHASSLPSPPSRPPSLEMGQDSPVRYPGIQQHYPVMYPEIQQDYPVRRAEMKQGRFDSPPQRYATASHDRPPSHSRQYPGRRAERYLDIHTSSGLYRRDSDYRDGIRSERDGRKPSLISRVAEFAERVIAATDRPSMKRKDHLSRRQTFRGRLALHGHEEPLGYENGDTRQAGETTI